MTTPILSQRPAPSGAAPVVDSASESKPRPRRQWTADEKAECVALFAESGLSAAAFCREMAISETTLALWRRQARGEPGAAPAFAAVELVAEAPLRDGAGRRPLTVTFHWPNGVATELTGLELASLVPLVRELGVTWASAATA